jgi:hypothetical protein
VSARLAATACPCGDGDGEVPAGDGLVVPLATGVGDGEGLVVVVGEVVAVVPDGLGGAVVVVLVGEGVLRDDVAVVLLVVPPTTDDVLLDGVEVVRVGRCVVVGVGVFCTVDGPPDSPEPFWRRATTSVPMTTAATRPTRAIIGRDTDRTRPPRVRTPPLPGSPTRGSGAVGGRW